MTYFKVENMSCGHCVAAVTAAVRQVDPGAEVVVDVAAGRVAVAGAAGPERVAAAIRAAGYPVADAAA